MAASLDLIRRLAPACIFAVLTACSSEPLQRQGPPSANQGGQGGAPQVAEPLTLPLLVRTRVSSDEGAAYFRAAFADVDFGRTPVASAQLKLRLESPCFPFSNWAELEIPAGQRWPAVCDAFDRKLSISLDDPSDAGAEGAKPGLELLRAVTPFGGPLELTADVTDVVNGLPGAHRLRVAIDTWGDAEGMLSGAQGEWLVSVDLELTPGSAPRRVLAVQPLFYGDQLEVDAPPASFVVPEGVRSARIDYRATGHGGEPDLGCSGPAEEFCQRTHELGVDGELLPPLSPWRSDCAALCTLIDNDAGFGPARYCAQNPCGAPSSVRAPRANWCPGSETPPIELEATSLLQPGEHQLTRRVRELHAGGLWTVSATYFAYE